MRRFFMGQNEISFVTTYAACYIFEVIHLVDDIRKKLYRVQVKLVQFVNIGD